PVDLDAMVMGLRLMGQDLFQPPNVKGWDGGLTWINTATLFNRYNVAGRIVSGTGEIGRRPGAMMMQKVAADDPALREQARPTDPHPPYAPIEAIRAQKLTTPEEVVDHFVDRLIGRPLSDERRQILIDALKGRLSDRKNLSVAANSEAVRELILLILATPEYQLS